MKAMILAAGRGERLRPLTDHTPKPLIQLDAYCLLEHHLQKLKQAGFTDIIINTAWLAEKIHNKIGDGRKYQLNIQYSDEGTALETGGGIKNALPLLGDDPFLVINGDTWCDYPLEKLRQFQLNHEAHLVLVDNPEHNLPGDFSIENKLLSNSIHNRYTFSGIGIYSKAFFHGITKKSFALAPLFRTKADEKKISAELFQGHWFDVGTLERLEQMRDFIRSQSNLNA